jgi:hypothetical protein
MSYSRLAVGKRTAQRRHAPLSKRGIPDTADHHRGARSTRLREHPVTPIGPHDALQQSVPHHSPSRFRPFGPPPHEWPQPPRGSKSNGPGMSSRDVVVSVGKPNGSDALSGVEGALFRSAIGCVASGGWNRACGCARGCAIGAGGCMCIGGGATMYWGGIPSIELGPYRSPRNRAWRPGLRRRRGREASCRVSLPSDELSESSSLSRAAQRDILVSLIARGPLRVSVLLTPMEMTN